MNQKTILNARAKLASALPSTTEILRGSLLHRRIRHRSGCAACARGKGHLVWVLTVSYPGGRNKQISLSAEQKAARPTVVAQLPKTQGHLGAHLRTQPQDPPAGQPPLIPSPPMSRTLNPQLSFADLELNRLGVHLDPVLQGIDAFLGQHFHLVEQVRLDLARGL